MKRSRMIRVDEDFDCVLNEIQKQYENVFGIQIEKTNVTKKASGILRKHRKEFF